MTVNVPEPRLLDAIEIIAAAPFTKLDAATLKFDRLGSEMGVVLPPPGVQPVLVVIANDSAATHNKIDFFIRLFFLIN